MLADKVKCNNCEAVNYVPRESSTCPVCKMYRSLSDVKQDVDVPSGWILEAKDDTQDTRQDPRHPF